MVSHSAIEDDLPTKENLVMEDSLMMEDIMTEYY